MLPKYIVGMLIVTSALSLEVRAQGTAQAGRASSGPAILASPPEPEPRGVFGRLRARLSGQEQERPQSRPASASTVPPPSPARVAPLPGAAVAVSVPAGSSAAVNASLAPTTQPLITNPRFSPTTARGMPDAPILGTTRAPQSPAPAATSRMATNGMATNVAPARTGSPAGSRVSIDPPVRRAQATSGDMSAPLGAGVLPGQPLEAPRSISLEAALYGAVTSNPDLVALRMGNAASAEAVEVARHFPTTLNPTLWVDYRPISLIPQDTFGQGGGGAKPTATHGRHNDSFGKQFLYVSWRQPIELRHQTTHRAAIAEAAFSQQQWTVVQAELTALVQTYRFYQTAAYRREKLRVAEDLARFNEQLTQALRRRLAVNVTPGLAADVAAAEVENEATRQLTESARQDYVNALTDLRNQIGIPETAGNAEPFGEFVLPPYIPKLQDDALIQTALQSRPEIQVAHAQFQGAQAAYRLACADRLPSPIIGPEYEIDEVQVQYIGFVYITPIPILNNNTPLVRQRHAELHRAAVAVQQVQERTVAQVKAATAKWNQVNVLVESTKGLNEAVKTHVSKIERLFNENQADLPKLLMARQRLIQLENAQLDAIWAATQAQSDLLLAIGAPTLIAAAQVEASQAAGAQNLPNAPAPPPPLDPPSPPSPSALFQPAAAPR